jgi:hypothetical protein
MMTQSRRMVTAALVAAIALGSTAALAGEGGGQHSAQRAKLKAEWAAARARNAEGAEATFVERLFGLDQKETTVATASTTAQRQKKN